MNITVISLKDIIKFAVCFILVVTIISIGINVLKKEEFEVDLEKAEEGTFSKLKNSSFLYILKTELPLITINDEKKPKDVGNASEKILATQLALMSNLEEFEEIDDTPIGDRAYIENADNVDNETVLEHESQNTEILENVQTQVIAEHNINATYTNTVSGTVKINNQTSFNINDVSSNYELTNKNKIVIYHTHTCESYTPSDKYNYKMTGSYRTTDLSFTVARVGDELEKYLKEYGKEVVHDKTYHDYPAYNGSYGRSLKTMAGVLGKNQDAEIAIDLHRDAVRK